MLGQKNLNQGASLPVDHCTVNPPYHSGYAIPIGTEATIYFKVQLAHEDGTPAAMIVGQATFLDDPSKEVVTVFTNKSGLIRSEGFRHGRYRLNLNDDEYDPVDFTIPESAGSDFDLGPIKIKARKH